MIGARAIGLWLASMIAFAVLAVITLPIYLVRGQARAFWPDLRAAVVEMTINLLRWG